MIKKKERASKQTPVDNESARASDSSTLVFYGDPQLVSDAFALALNAMERASQFGVSGGPRRSREGHR
ncbi:hypothetical protein AAFX91_28985 [Bradyrhizobium sp. 31Argb]|uniref:hypothetical protein n=1 Tax=Bradyrhizobium sp. 31Argb TaxID=3141247 RepID=UPI00374826AC